MKNTTIGSFAILTILAAMGAALLFSGCGDSKTPCTEQVTRQLTKYVDITCNSDWELLPPEVLACDTLTADEQPLDCEVFLAEYTRTKSLDPDTIECICIGHSRCVTGIEQCYSGGHVDPDDLYY